MCGGLRPRFEAGRVRGAELSSVKALGYPQGSPADLYSGCRTGGLRSAGLVQLSQPAEASLRCASGEPKRGPGLLFKLSKLLCTPLPSVHSFQGRPYQRAAQAEDAWNDEPGALVRGRTRWRAPEAEILIQKFGYATRTRRQLRARRSAGSEAGFEP